MKLGMCECESETCVAGMRYEVDGEVISGTEHKPGDCSSEATQDIRVYGYRQRLCEGCFSCSVVMSGTPYEVVSHD